MRIINKLVTRTILVLVTILQLNSCHTICLSQKTGERFAIKCILEESYAKGYQKKNTEIIMIVDTLIMISDFNYLTKKLNDSLGKAANTSMKINKLPILQLPYHVQLSKFGNHIKITGQKWIFSPLYKTKKSKEFIMFSKEKDDWEYESISAHLLRQKGGKYTYIKRLSNQMIWH